MLKVSEVCGYVCKLLDKLFVMYVSVAVLGCKVFELKTENK